MMFRLKGWLPKELQEQKLFFKHGQINRRL
jgi:hypothetical protein